QPGQQPVPPQGYPPQGYHPYAQPPRPKPPLTPRPSQLRTVLVLTVLGGVSAMVSYVLQARATDASEMLQQWREIAPELFADYTPAMVETSLWLSVAMVGMWALAAVGLAVCLLWRQEWARILLMLSAALVAPYGLVAGIAGSTFMLIAGVCAGAALFLLRSHDVKAWFSRR
ncbi:MAG: hypothetical protein ACI379_13400, partial [Nocardioides sp.]|uniref:hypothetical protein n=1 Tax=Nocardioides sp. TaxID=35761 RepID=UPI003F03B016